MTIKRVESAEFLGPNDSVTLATDNRIRWTDPIGMGGITITARIEGFAVNVDSPFKGEISFVAIRIEPSEDLERVAAEFDVNPWTPDGGKQIRKWMTESLIVTGDAFSRGVERGNITLAPGDES